MPNLAGAARRVRIKQNRCASFGDGAVFYQIAAAYITLGYDAPAIIPAGKEHAIAFLLRPGKRRRKILTPMFVLRWRFQSLLAGRVKRKVEPAPSWLATLTVPPWASTKVLTMARPRPKPPSLCVSVSSLSKIFSRRSAAMPAPLSLTQHSTRPASLSSRAPMITSPRGAVVDGVGDQILKNPPQQAGIRVNDQIIGHLIDELSAGVTAHRLQIVDQRLHQRPQIKQTPCQFAADVAEDAVFSWMILPTKPSRWCTLRRKVFNMWTLSVLAPCAGRLSSRTCAARAMALSGVRRSCATNARYSSRRCCISKARCVA